MSVIKDLTAKYSETASTVTQSQRNRLIDEIDSMSKKEITLACFRLVDDWGFPELMGENTRHGADGLVKAIVQELGDDTHTRENFEDIIQMFLEVGDNSESASAKPSKYKIVGTTYDGVKVLAPKLKSKNFKSSEVRKVIRELMPKSETATVKEGTTHYNPALKTPAHTVQKWLGKKGFEARGRIKLDPTNEHNFMEVYHNAATGQRATIHRTKNETVTKVVVDKHRAPSSKKRRQERASATMSILEQYSETAAPRRGRKSISHARNRASANFDRDIERTEDAISALRERMQEVTGEAKKPLQERLKRLQDSLPELKAKRKAARLKAQDEHMQKRSDALQARRVAGGAKRGPRRRRRPEAASVIGLLVSKYAETATTPSKGGKFKQYKKELAEQGITLRTDDSDYIVNVKGGSDDTAYYTDDLEDAYHTAKKMKPETAASAQTTWVKFLGRESFDDLLESLDYPNENKDNSLTFPDDKPANVLRVLKRCGCTIKGNTAQKQGYTATVTADSNGSKVSLAKSGAEQASDGSMTLAEAQAKLKSTNVEITRKAGVLCVNYKGADESTAFFTTKVEEAVHEALRMASRNREQAAVHAFRNRGRAARLKKSFALQPRTELADTVVYGRMRQGDIVKCTSYLAALNARDPKKVTEDVLADALVDVAGDLIVDSEADDRTVQQQLDSCMKQLRADTTFKREYDKAAETFGNKFTDLFD